MLGHGVGFNPCKQNMVLAHMRGALQGTEGLAREPGGKDRGWYIRLGSYSTHQRGPGKLSLWSHEVLGLQDPRTLGMLGGRALSGLKP